MKRHLAILAFVLAGVAPAQAAIDALDDVPAATLLLPYFQVDPTNANGYRTVFTIGNVSASEALAHVTLWTDLGVPTLTFDVRLPGHGVSEVDLHALFATGVLPQSSPGGFGSCSGVLPPAAFVAAELTGLRNAHSGLGSSLFGGQCGGAAHGDGLARGYVTIDVVGACSDAVPGDPGYFVLGGVGGTALVDNVLWGEYSTIAANGHVYGDSLVHIEASTTDPATDGAPNPPGRPILDYTFYGRLVGGTAADHREGLPERWMGQYSLEGTVRETTSVVWRDPGPVAPFSCATPPAPMTHREVVAFDDREEPAIGTAFSLPLAAQAVDLGDPARVDIPFSRGFIAYYLGVTGGDTYFANRNQAHVSHVLRALGDSGQATSWPAAPITSSSSPLVMLPACSDGVDNDGDGHIDFPDDPGCPVADVQDESAPCEDGLDNDSDGFTDYPDDVSCPNPYWFNEFAACSDGDDNDGDMLVDYPDDPECLSPIDITEGVGFQCADGFDNNGDGHTDWPLDPKCPSPFAPIEGAGQCDDAQDNDGDGQIDHPADAQCGSPAGDEQVDQCSDGIDNDGDGAIDHPLDSGCSDPFDDSELVPACSDGIDNDNDGAIDFPADIGCSFPFDNSEQNPQCSDGIDNDNDGTIDFPADFGCDDPVTDNSEQNPPCLDGLDNDNDGFTDYPEDVGCPAPFFPSEVAQCQDGFDNDFDNMTDAADAQCSGPNDPSEGAPQCSNGFDDDVDSLVDFPNDPQCESAADDFEFAPQCSDLVDNDGDGVIDFPADDGCTTAFDEIEQIGENFACSDRRDNDGDGDMDFPADPGCTNGNDRFEGSDCDDDLDNDLDGFADFPDDPGCESPDDQNELAGTLARGCSDGVDNDGDGFTDYPTDPGCTSAWDDVEFAPGTAGAVVESIPVASWKGLLLLALLLGLASCLVLRRS